jgi:uncharacterized protein YegJ (DUF2314 family)
MRFVVLIAINAILLSHVRDAFMLDIMNRDAQHAEQFWLDSVNRTESTVIVTDRADK